MRKMIWCAIALLSMANYGHSQNAVSDSDLLTIRIFNDDGLVQRDESFIGEEANQFDVLEFIYNHLDEGRILVEGRFQTDLQIDILHFDSDDLENNNSTFEICKKVDTQLKPFIGVQATSRMDLVGVGIGRVVENSAADELELNATDVILSFNGLDLVSPCELQEAVSQCEVGQVVQIDVVRGDQTIIEEITLGAQIYNTISYNYCDELDMASTIEDSKSLEIIGQLTSYPNPTDGMTAVQYQSNSTEPLSFLVFDMYGKTIHNQKITSFNGKASFDYNFSQQAAGTYMMTIVQDDKVFNTKVIFNKNSINKI